MDAKPLIKSIFSLCINDILQHWQRFNTYLHNLNSSCNRLIHFLYGNWIREAGISVRVAREAIPNLKTDERLLEIFQKSPKSQTKLPDPIKQKYNRQVKKSNWVIKEILESLMAAEMSHTTLIELLFLKAPDLRQKFTIQLEGNLKYTANRI